MLWDSTVNDVYVKNRALFWFQRSQVSPIPALIIAQEPLPRILEKSVSESDVPKLNRRPSSRKSQLAGLRQGERRTACPCSPQMRVSESSDAATCHFSSGPTDPRSLPGESLCSCRCALICSTEHLRILERLGVIQSLGEGTKQRFYCASPEADSLSHVGELRVHYSIGRASAWHHRSPDSKTFGCD